MAAELTSEHLRQLATVLELPASSWPEVSSTAYEFLFEAGTGSGSSKMFATVAQRLGVAPTLVKTAVQALSQLLLEAVRMNASAEKLSTMTIDAGLPVEVAELLRKNYDIEKPRLRSVLHQSALKLPLYKDLAWRFQVEVASRALHDQARPSVLMHLELDGVKDATQFFEVDPVNLAHMAEELETALAEASTAHFRSLRRQAK